MGESSESIYFQRVGLGIATLLPHLNSNTKIDVQDLIKAFEKQDKDAVIAILCNRSMEQRLQIADNYELITSAELTKSIKQLFWSNACKVLCGLSVPYYEYLAQTIYDSQSFRWLYYILFTIPNEEIILMKEYFFASKNNMFS